MTWASLIACILFSSVIYCDPVVNIINGKIRGQILKSRNGREYFSFTGIPYAKPPLENLRFKPPEPVDSWENILDGTKQPKMCIQINYFVVKLSHLMVGEEDCLYLNVYTPNVNGKVPVMVWIHGGGFFAGESGSKSFGPDYFLDKDIVLVTLNYRLGLLGFASTEDDMIPGNYGMKDQVAALRWIQDNVAAFGGDPGKVTIFGESAGSASVGFHLLSPMSKGLFHKAILQSGTPTCFWAVPVPGMARKRIEAVATIAGCYADTSEDILKCLSKLPADLLVKLSTRLFEWEIHPAVLFSPVVESCDSRQGAFLCHHPITDFKQESFVPIIAGYNSGEGGLLAASLYNDTSLRNSELQTHFNRMVASLLIYKHLSFPEDLDEIGNKIFKKYFPSGMMDDHTHSNAVDMIGDGGFTVGTINMMLKLSSPVYCYLYDYPNNFSFNKLYGECTKNLGVSHADELISLFKLNNVLPNGLIDEDLEVSKVMINIWTKFASSDMSPTINGTEKGLSWPLFTSIDSSLLHIDSAQPKIINSSFQENYRFWNNLPILSRLKKLASLKTLNVKNEL